MGFQGTWDGIQCFMVLASAVSSWLTTPRCYLLTFWSPCIFLPAFWLVQHPWLCIGDLFTYLAYFLENPSGPLKPLRYHPLSEDFLILTFIHCYSSDRVAESVCVHILTGDVDLNALTWFIYRIVSFFKMEFCLNTRTGSSLTFLIASSEPLTPVTAVTALCSCDPLGPCFTCPTQF